MPLHSPSSSGARTSLIVCLQLLILFMPEDLQLQLQLAHLAVTTSSHALHAVGNLPLDTSGPMLEEEVELHHTRKTLDINGYAKTLPCPLASGAARNGSLCSTLRQRCDCLSEKKERL